MLSDILCPYTTRFRSVPAYGGAALAGAGSGRAAQHVHVDRGPALVLDAAVPAADAEARLRAGLDHDVPEVLGARDLLRGAAQPRRRVRGSVCRDLRVGRGCAGSPPLQGEGWEGMGFPTAATNQQLTRLRSEERGVGKEGV